MFIGIGVAAVVILIVVAIVLGVLVWKARKDTKKDGEKQKNVLEMSPVNLSSGGPQGEPQDRVYEEINGHPSVGVYSVPAEIGEATSNSSMETKGPTSVGVYSVPRNTPVNGGPDLIDGAVMQHPKQQQPKDIAAMYAVPHQDRQSVTPGEGRDRTTMVVVENDLYKT